MTLTDTLRAHLPTFWWYGRGILILAVSLWIGFCGILFFNQRALLYPSPVVGAESERQSAPGQGFSPYAGGQDALAPLDGNGVRAWASQDPQTPKILGTVILFHGNGTTALQRAVYAQALRPLGYRVILAEYPGYGSFPGVASEASVARANNELIKAVERDFPGPTFAMGESLGSAAAARAVKDNPGVFSGVFLITPWESLKAVASQHYPWVPVAYLLRERHDSAAALSSFRGPVLIVAGDEDDVIPASHARALYDGLPTPAKTFTLLHGGHTTWGQALPQGFWAKATAEAFGRGGPTSAPAHS